LTGYLGGAVASHARLGDPLLTHDLFGVYFGLFVWGGLWFRDSRVRRRDAVFLFCLSWRFASFRAEQANVVNLGD
jgi:hypothetical protein